MTACPSPKSSFVALDPPGHPRAGDVAGRPARHRRELWWSWAGLALTAVVSVAVAASMLLTLDHDVVGGRWGQLLIAVAADASIAALIYGGLVYCGARLGHYRRLITAPSMDPGEADQLFAPAAEPGLLTVLIPSYREDVEVVWQTVLSAALQDYPDRRVVLLVDDPPAPREPQHAAALAAVLDIPARVDRLLRSPRGVLAAEEGAFLTRAGEGMGAARVAHEAMHLQTLYQQVADWFTAQASREPSADHTGRLFTQLTFTARAQQCRGRVAQLAADSRAGTLTVARLQREHRRLASMFTVDVSVFQRKRYANLSRAANKAMNLNAYIGLLGYRWRPIRRPDGLHLERAPAGGPAGLSGAHDEASVDVPASPWLLTVDADSLLVHDYASRLVASLRRPEHARVAVMQTPYSAVPGATAPVERTAGATTDIMHLVHQGTTHFGATYWVGANALIRTEALADITVTGMEGRTLVRRYIQDRTVIEDTESTVDLVDAGWGLHNYPARLAYSATPPDYGSLLIQRRRWANGGLIILPKLLRSLRRSGLRGRLAEAALRIHYLISIATANLALLALTVLPFSQSVPVLLLAATSMPYFVLYARDLRLLGRRRGELLEVYALNLLLVPVNLGGVVMSLRQAVTGRSIPFGRTPKVSDRTAAPPLYLLATLALLALWGTGATVNALAGRDAQAVLTGLNAAVMLVAVGRYIGWRHTAHDVTAPLRNRRDSRSSVSDSPAPHTPPMPLAAGPPAPQRAREAA